MNFVPSELLAAQNLIDGPHCTIGPIIMFFVPSQKNILIGPIVQCGPSIGF